MSYKKYWRITLTVLIVSLLVFGTALVGLSAEDRVGPINSPDDINTGSGENEPTPAELESFLKGYYNNPEFKLPCELQTSKYNEGDPSELKDKEDDCGWFREYDNGNLIFEAYVCFSDEKDDDPGEYLSVAFSQANKTVYAFAVKYGGGTNTYYYPNGTTADGPITVPAQQAISHITFYYCEGEVDYEELTVSKTAVTSYTRTHEWNIDKKVETAKGYELDDIAKIWLYIDGSGVETATWTVDVTYEGYDDSDFNVSGTITIENTGDLDAVITGVEDLLDDEEIDVDFGVTFPYTLEAGETLTGTYSEDGYVEGFNEVTVTTERDEYFADAEIIWGDPTTEINKTVNIKDISDLFGEVNLGTVTAPNDAQFTYTKDFAWADYGTAGSYTYNNTATIIETSQSADAVLKVNVQGFVYETAYAKGDYAVPFIPTFRNWGWTNPITPGAYEMDLWAGAGQNDTSKGTLVGSVTVGYNSDGHVAVTYKVDSPYALKETHVYAGYDMFPQIRQGRRTVSTVAPGQYYNAGPFDGSQVYVIAHAVVGLPDPSFGPAN